MKTKVTKEKAEQAVRITESCHRDLKITAAKAGLNLGQMVEAALAAWEREQLSKEIDLDNIQDKDEGK